MEFLDDFDAIGQLIAGLKELVFISQGVLKPFLDKYYASLALIAQYTAPIFTIAAGSYAIYQKYHFAERNMPKRIEEFLAREDKRLTDSRSAVFSAAATPGPALEFAGPIFTAREIGAAAQRMGYGKFRRADGAVKKASRQVNRKTKELGDQLRTWDAKRIEFKKRRASTKILQGALAAARAEKRRQNGLDVRRARLAALGHFENAFELDPGDLRALEHAGHQRVRLGEHGAAIEDFQQLAELAESVGDRYRQARALRFKGEIQEFKTPPVPGAANMTYSAAIDSMPMERGEERAELWEMRGRVQEQLNFYTAAQQSYSNAEQLYDKAGGKFSKAGIDRVKSALHRLNDGGGPQPNTESKGSI